MRQLILARGSPNEPVNWAQLDGGSVIASGIEPSLKDFADKSSLMQGGLLTVILPGEMVAIRTISSPAKSEKKLIQSARFLLEDELAAGVDDQHIVFVGRTADDEARIAAIDRSAIAEWCDELRKCGLSAEAITADFLILNDTERNGCRVLRDADRIVFSDGEAGFAAEVPLATELLTDLASENREKDWTCYNCNEIMQAINPEISIRHVELSGEQQVLSLYARNLPTSMHPGFLQGEFSQRTEWSPIWLFWRMPVLLVSAVFVLWIAGFVFQGMKLNGSANVVLAEAESQFVNAFPEVVVRDLHRQAASRAGPGNESGPGFLELMIRLMNYMEKNDGAQVLSVTYGGSGQLTADMRFNSIETLDSLKTALEAGGVIVREGQSLTPVSGDIVIGKVMLSWQ